MANLIGLLNIGLKTQMHVPNDLMQSMQYYCEILIRFGF